DRGRRARDRGRHSRGDRSDIVTRRRPTLRTLGLMVLALLVLAWRKDNGGGGGSNSFLFENNAQFNGGRTVRWAALPIRVFLGNGVAAPGGGTAWTASP